MVERSDVIKVADDLHLKPSDEQIQQVIAGFDDESTSDPSGSLELWIENLLYSLMNSRDQLAAVKYLVSNGVGSSEWQEAGMWNAVCRVMRDADNQWETTELDQLIEDAGNN